MLYLTWHRKRFPGFAATPETDLIVEGFPRSGNSFFEASLNLCETGDQLRVAHHVHAPTHVRYGVKNHIPTVVLIRDPIDAVASLLNMEPETHTSPAWQELHLRQYIRYYRVVEQLLDRLILIPFDLIRSDFGEVVRRINERADLCITCPSPFPIEEAWNYTDQKTAERTHFESSGYSANTAPAERSARRATQARIGESLRNNLPRATSDAEELYRLLTENSA